MRPIRFFEHLERLQTDVESDGPRAGSWWTALTGPFAERVRWSGAFADQLATDAFRNFLPGLPQAGLRAHRTLLGAALLLDKILDEERADPTSLARVTHWMRRRGEPVPATRASPDNPDPDVNTLLTALDEYVVDCRGRSPGAGEYELHHAELTRMFEAELASVEMAIGLPPDRCVRATIRAKSVDLAWVGFHTCILGEKIAAAEMAAYRQLCDALGHVMWVADDLADVEEDLAQGVWNRVLWMLYDQVGDKRFRLAIASSETLRDLLRTQRVVETVVMEIAERVEFLTSHSRVSDPARLHSMLAFWVTSWLDIYE